MADPERQPSVRGPIVSIGEVIYTSLDTGDEPVNPGSTLRPIIEHDPLDPTRLTDSELLGTPDGFSSVHDFGFVPGTLTPDGIYITRLPSDPSIEG